MLSKGEKAAMKFKMEQMGGTDLKKTLVGTIGELDEVRLDVETECSLVIVGEGELDLKNLFMTIPFGRVRKISLTQAGNVRIYGNPRQLIRVCRSLEDGGIMERRPGLSYGILEDDMITTLSKSSARKLKE